MVYEIIPIYLGIALNHLVRNILRYLCSWIASEGLNPWIHPWILGILVRFFLPRMVFVDVCFWRMSHAKTLVNSYLVHSWIQESNFSEGT